MDRCARQFVDLAVGDAVQVKHFVSDDDALISLAGPANKQGRVAADTICGRERAFAAPQGSSVLKVFDMTIASTGLSESAAARAGIACDKALASSPSHATYYPGARSMSVKTVFEPESGRILGAQIVGFEGVDKRIDVIATSRIHTIWPPPIWKSSTWPMRRRIPRRKTPSIWRASSSKTCAAAW